MDIKAKCQVNQKGVIGVFGDKCSYCGDCKNGCSFGLNRVYCNKDGRFHSSQDEKRCFNFAPKGIIKKYVKQKPTNCGKGAIK